MQGFARRYFTLYQSGLLSYAFEPGQPVRDQIFLNNAAISTSPGRKDIHIDSNTATFHIKCLSTEDFNNWMTAFRKFISIGIEAKKAATIRHAARQASVSLNRSGALLEEMGNKFLDLESSIQGLSRSLEPSKPYSLKRSDKHGYSKESMFGLFKKPQHHHSQDSGGEASPESSRSVSESLDEVKTNFDALKAQYSTLVKSMQISFNEATQQAHSPLPFTAEEEENTPSHRQRVTTAVTGISLRDSITSSSGSFVEWFDADEGPQEFFMEPGPEMSEPPSRMLSTATERDTSSIDTDFEEPDTLSSPVQEIGYPSIGDLQVARRVQLPCLPPSDEGSLFAILKKNVGKDLSTITFPVTFNEPLTLLQRAAEEVEYHTLLDEAASATDPVSRMSYVAAFAVSSYAHTRHRSGRKGFNPMLAETFEDHRMKFIAEKVRHNPLEIAYHAEGDNWELNATSCGRTKFWGKSLEIIPMGVTRLKIDQDIYVWNKPSSFIRNLMVGTKYFEHTGKMTIENSTSQVRCVLDFKQNGYWGPSNVVSGTIYDSQGDTIGQLDGKWDDQMCQILDASHLHVLWKPAPFPKNAPECYGFTSFSITLNEITSDLVAKLPPTDSRNRPDVRALENGELDLAEEEKLRVEQLQRERRNAGKERQPKWFKYVDDQWQYVGGYWEARSRAWKQEAIQPLW